MSHEARDGRNAGTMILGIVIVAQLLLSTAMPAVPSDPPAPIEPGVFEQLERGPHATFWVVMTDQADLAGAVAIEDWNERGQWVYDRLHAVAEEGQAGVLEVLDRRGAPYQSFWIVSALRVTGDRHLVEELSRHPRVARVADQRSFTVPDPGAVIDGDTADGVEWNIDLIRAPEVWSTFGVTGEGVVVANIDTGVQFDHSALAGRYRGNLGGAGFEHDYNWFDPSNVCGTPSLAPCDNHGHGTHTMGTMVGDDLASNRIGVAPGARWIAAKGCETNSCSDAALLASAQWILAPTDLDGNDPRPDLRPHVVNNSWGGGGGSAWYMGFVDAWIAAGIFPQFSNGNSGPSCGTAGSPGDYPQSYSAGSFADGGAIASSSSRGPSAFAGETKPNVAAPGVNIRSSVPTDGYAFSSGTSMASPHVAGTVALMWSAAPSLVGDVAWTRDLLDDTAVDAVDLTCGGTADDNNVYGEGRLDAFAAVDQSPHGPTGILSGTVTDAATAVPLSGATVRAVGDSIRTAVTDDDGTYSLLVAVGDYAVTANAFGYLDASATVNVSEAGSDLDFALETSPRHRVHGVVIDTLGVAVASASVTILGTPIPPAVTDIDGGFAFDDVPEGSYQLYASGGRCALPATTPLIVDSDQQLMVTLSVRSDDVGYGCRLESPAFMPGADLVLLGDDTQATVALPFDFTFYGEPYSTAYVATNGFVHFEPSLQTFFYNASLPQLYLPNAAIYAFWDNLVFEPLVDPECGVFTSEGFTDGRHWFLVEWRNAAFYGDDTRQIDFEVVLFDDGEILAQYRDIDPDGRERGDGAGFGLENADGTVGFQYSHREAVISPPSFAIRYLLLPSGTLRGAVVDTNDGDPIAGAEVTVHDDNGNLIRDTRSDSGGAFEMSLPVGSYTVAATALNYSSGAADITMTSAGDEEDVVLELETGRPQVTPPGVSFTGSGEATVTLANTGTATLRWSISEQSGGRSVDVGWLAVSPVGGELNVGDSDTLTVTADTLTMMPGSYAVELVLTSDAGRTPRLEIPVALTVGTPGLELAVNCGGAGYVDSNGAAWLADQEYTSESWGFTDFRARARSTEEDIKGTIDDPIFQTFLRRPGSYRFDNLPGSKYALELSFAESEAEVVTGDRIFDVVVGTNDLLLGYDIVAAVGRTTADRHRFTVAPVKGTIEIEFDAARRSLPAIINGIRLVQEE